jgi:hypothetical protein
MQKMSEKTECLLDSRYPSSMAYSYFLYPNLPNKLSYDSSKPNLNNMILFALSANPFILFALGPDFQLDKA